jgi:hypothetical protein
MLVGVIAGILAFCFAEIFGEPEIDRAIAFEEQAARAAGEMTMPELVSRPVQSGIGLFTGVVVYGSAMGGLLALVFAYIQGRISQLRPRATSLLIALAAFVTISIVPAIKYPANPPSIGEPDTIAYRTELFLAMLAISIGALIAAIAVARRLRHRHGTWNACVVAGACFVAAITIADMALPSLNEVPAAFSAVVLWRFRVASLGVQLVLWTMIGLLFGTLTEHEALPPFRGIWRQSAVSRRREPSVQRRVFPA